METVVKYGLKHIKSGKMIGYYTSSNSPDDCSVSTEYKLSQHEDNVWLVSDPILAEWVRNHSTQWYNADYETPNHDFEPEELRVVKVTQTIEYENVKVKTPTDWECFELRYGKKDPGHLEYLKREIEKGQEIEMDRYGMMEIARDHKDKFEVTKEE